MAMMLNEYDVQDAYLMYVIKRDQHDALTDAVYALTWLVSWTNEHSDGWCYWRKPAAAARALQDIVRTADRETRGCRDWSPTDAQVAAALRPVKAFLTRQEVPLEHRPAILR